MPAQVAATVRWFERALEDNHFVWMVSGERFFVRVVPLLFAFCAYIATRHTQTEASVAAIWPANGLLLAGLLLSDSPRIRMHTLVACFAANILVNLAAGQPATVSVAFAAINAAEATMAYGLLQYCRVRDLEFTDSRTLIKFIVTCALSTVVPAMAGAAIVAVSAGADFLAAFSTWFVADALGLLVITPAFALAFRPGRSARQQIPAYKFVVLFGLLLAVCSVVFGQSSVPLLFLVTPVCVAIAFQFGPRYAAFTTLFLSAVSIYATYSGFGPAAVNTASEAASRVWMVQLFCLINLFTTLFVAAAIAERDAMSERIEMLSETEHESRRNLDAALDAMNQGLCLFDRQSRIVARNDHFLKLYKLDAALVPIGLPFQQLLKRCASSDTPVTAAASGLPLMADGDTDQLLSDGRTIRISQRRTASGGVICTYTDITVERKAEHDLRHTSLHDALTGLPNRRYFADQLNRLCQPGHKSDAFSVMLIDVDHFKDVNDSYGHAAGDQLLQVVGTRLSACVRASDTVARIGGDEFAVILTETKDESTAPSVARRMLSAVEQPVAIDGAVGLVTLSIGVARHSPDVSADALMKLADTALYQVKQGGRNNVIIAGDAAEKNCGGALDTVGSEAAPEVEPKDRAA